MKQLGKSLVFLLLLSSAINIHAANHGAPALPPGMGRYILVLKVVDERPGTPKTITEPDVAKLGGTVLSKYDNRRVINLPPAAARNLRADKNVAYLQRVWMGEPLENWDERDLSSGSSLKGQSDDTAGANLTWSSGGYQYDPDGNIEAIGTDTYTYDTAARLVKAVVNGQTETYGYDSFGNLTQKALSGQSSTIPSIDSSSNRIIGASYDAAGNVTSNGSKITYEFDSVGAMSGMVTKLGQHRRFIYTAEDERIGKELTTVVRWTIRDFNTGKVLREFQDAGLVSGDAWEWTEDYVYAGGTLVGAETEQAWGGKRHFHLDHLGTVRMVTNDQHMRYSRNDFLPFGTEQTSSVQESTNFGYWRSDPMKFTSHEREFYGDLNVDNTDYLDYMHARYYNPNMGRFLSVDPVLGTPGNPQSWNRYAYVRNRPLTLTDPKGLWAAACRGNDMECQMAAAFFEGRRVQAEHSGSRRVREAAKAWGARDDAHDKRVLVTFVSRTTMNSVVGSGATGGVAPRRDDPNHRTDWAVVGIFPTDLAEIEVDRAIAHEGVHVRRQKGFLSSWNPASGFYAAASNYMVRDDEREGYETGGDVFPYNFGGKSLNDYITQKYGAKADQLKFDPANYPQQ